MLVNVVVAIAGVKVITEDEFYEQKKIVLPHCPSLKIL